MENSRDLLAEVKTLIEEKFTELDESKYKEKFTKGTKLSFQGNQRQFDFNAKLIEKLYNIKSYVKRGSLESSKRLLKDVIRDLGKQQKCIRIADKSPGRWATVEEYLTDDLASDSDDDRRIKRAEKRVLERQEKEKKQVEDRRKRNKRTQPQSYSREPSSP